eukprot:2304401-Pleurochrysis_carterae.AAC.1
MPCAWRACRQRCFDAIPFAQILTCAHLHLGFETSVPSRRLRKEPEPRVGPLAAQDGMRSAVSVPVISYLHAFGRSLRSSEAALKDCPEGQL